MYFIHIHHQITFITRRDCINPERSLHTDTPTLQLIYSGLVLREPLVYVVLRLAGDDVGRGRSVGALVVAEGPGGLQGNSDVLGPGVWRVQVLGGAAHHGAAHGAGAPHAHLGTTVSHWCWTHRFGMIRFGTAFVLVLDDQT